jgi:hypothetical protein
MFKVDANYTDYRNDTDPNMPGGAAISASNPQLFDGTPWRALFFNHLHGFFQALYIKAFGSLDGANGISGQPDNAAVSDGLKAIERLIEKSFDDQYLIKTISGVESTIPLAELPFTYDPLKNYLIYISPNGDYPEFLNFGAVLDENGLHIFPRRFIDGKIIPGTRDNPWGQGLWGDGLWGGYGSMPINIIIKER